MPSCGKNALKIFFSRTKRLIPWDLQLVYRIGDSDPTNDVQIMTFGWPWPHYRQGQRRRFTNHPNWPCKSGEKSKSVNKREDFHFQDRHLFSCAVSLFLCYRVLNIGRVSLFWCFSVIFKSLIANLTRGIATLQNEILTVLKSVIPYVIL